MDTAVRSCTNSSVVHHFESNLELSGFGAPGEALVQTVKELVDNAVDACRCRSFDQDAPTVRVVLRRRSKSNNTDIETLEELEGQEDEPLELQVADNGDGLNDVTKALVLFSSSKSGHGSGSLITSGPSSTVGEKKKRNESQEQNAGKYGLGLTLSLLYSQKHFGGFLKATTARRDSREWTSTKCDIDLETGLPRTLYSKTGLKPDSWSDGCGTDMRLLVPGGEDALGFAEPRLKALFSRLHLLPDRAAGVSFVCQGCLDDTSIVVPRGGREASPHLLIDNEDLVRAFAKGLTAMTRAFNAAAGIARDGVDRGASSSSGPSSPTTPHSNVSMGEVDGELTANGHQTLEWKEQQQQQQPRSTATQNRSINDGQTRSFVSFSHGVGVVEASSSSGSMSSRRVGAASGLGCLYGHFAEEDVAVFECQAGEIDSSWITAGVAVERTLPSRRKQSSSASASASGAGETIVPLFVHRFANGVPMLDTNTSAACALVAGVTSKVSWANLGLRISSSRMQRRGGDGRLWFMLSEAPTPLKVKGGEDWSALSGIKAVHVAVTANSKVIPYTSLRKDAIAHREGYVSAAESAVRQALVSLCRRTSGGFRSAFEAAHHMLHQELLPLASSSVAYMVSHSADVSFQKRCLQALGVGNEYEYVQERRLTDLLQVELTENVRQEEARRAAAKARAMARIKEEAEKERGKQRRGNKSRKRKSNCAVTADEDAGAARPDG